MKTILPSLLFWGTLAVTSPASALSLSEYLGQVQKQNLSVQGQEQQAGGSGLLAREADLIFTPQLTFDANIGHDAKLSSPPAMIYDDRKSQTYSLGVSQQFRFGLQSKISYDVSRTSFDGANFGPNVLNSYWDAAPKLELSMSLWQNAFGRGARLNEEVTRQQALGNSYNSLAQAQNLMVEAEAAYWRLASAQESVRIQEQALKGSENILNYVSRKMAKNLGEEADILQARALVESYKLQLQQAQTEERASRRGFNKYLYQEADETVPALEGLNYQSLQQVAVPAKRPGDRWDVKAAEAQLAVARASSEQAAERSKPVLEVFGNYALNGRAAEARDALDNVNGSERDTGYVGLRFRMPLNLSATADARKGAAQNRQAAELNAQAKRYSQEQEWIDLTQKLSDAKESLRLATAIENAQKAKLENERGRLRQGRTTTYQVLMFEQDYSQSQVSRVRAASQILSLQSQIKLYQASDEGGVQ
ncbi:MAG: TolC family protein [Bdellovibrionaceae bacterium]|nr:TolC family protein [Pseudobdellovibrionaceae bacterium]MBX3034661.1 TolC family protein [Pseudobdellovibrionaceae bacterium]